MSHRTRAQAPPTETLIFAPAADTYVDAGHQGTNYDTDTRLRGDSLGHGSISYTSASVTDINNPMSTKQTVTPQSGILVEASSRADHSYWHSFFVP